MNDTNIYVYKLIWKDPKDKGEWTYYGQSKNPKQRLSEHCTNPRSHAVYELVNRIGRPDMELLVYSKDADHIDKTENRYIQEAVERGERVVNRFGVNYGQRGKGGKGPVPGTRLNQQWDTRRNENRKQRKYARDETAWKTCSWCGRHQPASSYNTDRNRTSGLASKCRDCVRFLERKLGPAKRKYGAGAVQISEAYKQAKAIMLKWRRDGQPGEHPGLPHPTDVVAARQRAKPGEPVCSVPDCDRRVYARQLCVTCYSYFAKKKVMPPAPPHKRRAPSAVESRNIRQERRRRGVLQ